MGILKYFFTITTFLFFCGSVNAGNVPSVYFDLPASKYPPTAKLEATIFVDTDIPINAVSLEIGYTANTLAFVSSDASDSWVSFWRDFPPSPENGVLKLEGGMAMPFVGKKGELIKLIFLATEEGPAQISFRKATLFAADGKGTPLVPLAAPINLEISSSAEFPPEGQTIGEIIAGIYDTTKPEISEIQVLKNPEDGSLLLIFRPKDRETGIQSVTMRERSWFLWGEEQKAASPLKVSQGVWNVKLKAVDNAGNVTTKTVILWGEAIKKALLIVVIAIAITFFKSKTKKYYKVINLKPRI